MKCSYNFRNIFHFPFSILNYRKGFTLIETVIYIALFSLITGFVMIVFYQILTVQDQHRFYVEIDQEANFMMQKMLWAVTGAERLLQPSGGATSTILTVDLAVTGQNLVTFDIDSGSLRINRASSTLLLTSSRVFVNELIFTHLPSIDGSAEGVKIKLGVVPAGAAPRNTSTTLEQTMYLKI